MLLKPFSARAALKPATAASRAGWLTICVMPILYALLVSALALGLLELPELPELPPQPAMTPARATTTSGTTSKTTLNARSIVLLSTTDECAILVRAASRAQAPVSSLFSAYARRRWTAEVATVVVGTQYAAAMHPCAAPQPATGAPAP